MVLPAKEGPLPYVGIRYPDCLYACALIAAAEKPLFASSANYSGDPAAVASTQVIQRFDGHIDMILDGGMTRLKKESTIIKIEQGKVSLIREGSLPADLVMGYARNDKTGE